MSMADQRQALQVENVLYHMNSTRLLNSAFLRVFIRNLEIDVSILLPVACHLKGLI